MWFFNSSKNSKEKYFTALKYFNPKPDERNLAIKHIQEYLNGSPYEEAYKNTHHLVANKPSSLDQEKDIHIAEMYKQLGKVYEAEYELDKALECYKKTRELVPFFVWTYCYICSILVKQNKLNEANNVYLEAKKSKYYKPIKYKDIFGESHIENTFKTVIDNKILELQQKIEKGYVYKPRKK